jgi:hypothetical protein
MSFSDSSATFLLNAVTAGKRVGGGGGGQWVGGEFFSKLRTRIWGRLQHVGGSKEVVKPLDKREGVVGAGSSQVLRLGEEGRTAWGVKKGLD